MKKIRFFLVLLIVIALIAFVYGLYIDKENLSVLTYNYGGESFVHVKQGELLKGDKVDGEFVAKDNNLGILSVRFLTYGRVNTDSFAFRMKEKGKDDWYYVNKYSAREFGGYPLFPFGFPIIADAKGRTYSFELESLNGKPGKAIGISTVEPVIVAKHKFRKEELISDKRFALSFILKKSASIFQDASVLRLFALGYIVLISPLLLRKFTGSKSVAQLSLNSQTRLRKNLQIAARRNWSFTATPLCFVGKIAQKGLRKLVSLYDWFGRE